MTDTPAPSTATRTCPRARASPPGAPGPAPSATASAAAAARTLGLSGGGASTSTAAPFEAAGCDAVARAGSSARLASVATGAARPAGPKVSSGANTGLSMVVPLRLSSGSSAVPATSSSSRGTTTSPAQLHTCSKCANTHLCCASRVVVVPRHDYVPCTAPQLFRMSGFLGRLPTFICVVPAVSSSRGTTTSPAQPLHVDGAVACLRRLLMAPLAANAVDGTAATRENSKERSSFERTATRYSRETGRAPPRPRRRCR